MLLPRPSTDNPLILVVNQLIAAVGAVNPEAGLAAGGIWATLIISYSLFYDSFTQECEEFVRELLKKSNEINVALPSSVELQQSLLITLNTLLETRTQVKRSLVMSIYTNEYLPNGQKGAFQLERVYRVIQEISPESLLHLKFIEAVILPRKEQLIREKINSIINREGDDAWWYDLEYSRLSESVVVQEWINEEYSINSPKVNIDEPDSETHRAEWKSWMQLHGDMEREKQAEFAEYSSELISLGIFRIRAGGYTLTEFGTIFLRFLRTGFV